MMTTMLFLLLFIIITIFLKLFNLVFLKARSAADQDEQTIAVLGKALKHC